MTSSITPIPEAQREAQLYKTPKESFQAEAEKKARMEMAKELRIYDEVVDYFIKWVHQRCRTTELIQPNIKPGNPQLQANYDKFVRIEDYGFHPKEWHRRTKEVEALERIDAYIDKCIDEGTQPTLHGLLSIAHVGQSTGQDEWYTPPKYIESARLVMGDIDLDPASSDRANTIVKAKRYYTWEDDGLAQTWEGRVWMNPPYSRELIDAFVSKLALHVEEGEVIQAVVLVNNATETSWGQQLIGLSSGMVFPEGRIKFLDATLKPTGAPLQGQVFFYIGTKLQPFLDEFTKHGKGVITHDKG